MSEKIELKSCPFCGGEAEAFTRRILDCHIGYAVRCASARDRCVRPVTDLYPTPKEAAAVWNWMAEKKIELKTCPFCGCKAHVNEAKEGGILHVKVHCGNLDCDCYARTHWCDTLEEAAAAWNRRCNDGE